MNSLTVLLAFTRWSPHIWGPRSNQERHHKYVIALYTSPSTVSYRAETEQSFKNKCVPRDRALNTCLLSLGHLHTVPSLQAFLLLLYSPEHILDSGFLYLSGMCIPKISIESLIPYNPLHKSHLIRGDFPHCHVKGHPHPFSILLPLHYFAGLTTT